MNKIAKQRLFLNAAKDALFPENSEEAATLYAAVGDEIPDEAHERFGLVDGALPGFEPKEEIAGQDENNGAGTGEAAAKEAEEKAAAEAAAKEAEEKAAAEAAAKEAEEKAASKSEDKAAKPAATKGGK